MQNGSTKLRELRLTAWHRRLIIGAVIALTSQLYLSAWVEGFRVSAAVILYPVLLVIMMRDSHRPDAGAVTGVCVILARTALDMLSGASLLSALRLEYPGGVFYLVYDCLLCLLVRDRRTASPARLGLAFWVCDFVSNTLNLILSEGSLRSLQGTMLLSLAGLALARAFTAAAVLWLTQRYHQLLLHQEHERRYQRLFLMTAELKNELYFLRKSAEETEQVMANAYRLYEQLGDLELPDEVRALALSIARDVHEVKKDNLRIIRGLEGEVADAYDQETIYISDLMRILEDSTRRLLGEQRSGIRLECRCNHDFATGEHYLLIAVLKNLVTNAAEAIQSAGGRGTIRVLEQVQDGRLALTVEDDGPGIPPRAMQNLFQVGYSTKFDPETGNIGRGVGLPSVRHIVDELGGTIQVDSTPGRGARFLVEIPMATLTREHEEEPA